MYPELLKLAGVVGMVVHPNSVILIMRNSYWIRNSGHIPFFADHRIIALYNRERLSDKEWSLVSQS